jgi:hypothetical protein
MEYQFLNIFLEPKELLTQSKESINTFLLENNAFQIGKLYDFFKSHTALLFVNGFSGTGKLKIVNYSTTFLSTETIVLKYNCYSSTSLDDILLSFFWEFKKLSSQNVIVDPKVKTENFTQKINSYFSQIERPFVIILNSFHSILEENRQDILDFIFHLNMMPKVKIIIIGRIFENKYFKNVKIERISTQAFEKDLFDKYVKSKKIKTSHSHLEELYKHTRGYYFFTALSIILMKNQGLSLEEFLIKFNNSYLAFHNFLEKQSLSIIPPSERNLFWFLAIIRHSVDIDLLKKLNLINLDKFDFLIDNFLLINDDSQIYIQDYLKEELEESISEHISYRIRQYIIDLYSTQLPLKPLERNICISRQTMRKEIEFHKLFLPKKPKTITNSSIDINYLSYVKVFDIDEKQSTEDNVAKKDEDQFKNIYLQSDLMHKKNININLENLAFQKEKENQRSIQDSVFLNLQTCTLKELMQKAKLAEANYDYSIVIEIYQKALLLKEDENYDYYLSVIYTKLAYAYKKNADYENSIKYYKLAEKNYKNTNDSIKVLYMKLNIANIFYETYKVNNAKELLLEIIASNVAPEILILKCCLLLANIEEASGIQNSFKYYKLALENVNQTKNVKVLSELYFKYALIMDDKNDTKAAFEFYNKCIDVSNDEKINKFLSPAYSNLANLYLEKNDTLNAIKYYKEALKIDKQNDNIEGIYYSSLKIASILQKEASKETIEYLNTALDCAKLLKDVFYIVSASLAMGDYFYDNKQNEVALKYYINAFDLAQNNFSIENINKINMRINDIKFRIGIENFDKIVEIIRKENENNYE